MDKNHVLEEIAQKNLSFLQGIKKEWISSLCMSEYQELCAKAVQMDWSAGLVCLRGASEGTDHATYWRHADGRLNPGHAFFWSAYSARPSCLREMAPSMTSESLLHAVLIGSHNENRPLRMTQSRIRCFHYLTKELGNRPSDEVFKIMNQGHVINAILENVNAEVVQSFFSILPPQVMWSNIWEAGKFYQKNNIITPDAKGASSWAARIESLWLATDRDIRLIPEEIKEHLLELVKIPGNQGFFPHIHSELSKEEIRQSLSLPIQNQPLSKKKKI